MFSNLERPLYELKAGLFKGVAHPIRIRILEVLSATEEVSVSQLISEIDIEASHLSQHLSVLRQHRLVRSERRGSQVFYRIAHPHVSELLRVARGLLTDMLESTHQQLSEASALPNISPNPTQKQVKQ